MKKRLFRFLPILLIAALLLSGCMEEMPQVTTAAATSVAATEQTTESTRAVPTEAPEETTETADSGLPEDGCYISKEDVAAFLNQYGHLPDNFITKKQAKALGWDGSGKTLWDYADGKSIGGDWFGNYEGLLPEAPDREYHECDIDYTGHSRGAKRIVFSNDGLIYYTDDHYENFTLLYGDVSQEVRHD